MNLQKYFFSKIEIRESSLNQFYSTQEPDEVGRYHYSNNDLRKTSSREKKHIKIKTNVELLLKMKYDEHKWRTFFLTFVSYSGLHMMRMAYSHNKPNFKNAFHQSNLFLGLFDALTYISLGLGFFFRFLLQKQQHLTKSFFILITFCSLGYSCLPICSLLLGEKVLENEFIRVGIPAISLLLFGFFQFPAWPSLMTITSQHFDIKSEGKAMGFWSANGDFGNIIGFGISGILVNSLNLRWQIVMLTVAIINWSLALSVYLLVDQYQREEETSLMDRSIEQADQQVEGKERFRGFLNYSQYIMKPGENKLYLLSMGLTKAILYGFLLWMPTYLAHNGFASYTSIIPIIFNVGTLLGSFILGHFYEDLQDNAQPIQYHFKKYFLVYSCVGVIGSLALFYLFNMGIILYLIMSLLSGAFLGGCFNMLASNEVISISEGQRKDINYLSTLSMVIGNLMVGVVELIIGVVLDMKNDPAGEHKLFVILVLVGLLAIAVLLCRINMLHEQENVHSS